jgi:hypothetical protein
MNSDVNQKLVQKGGGVVKSPKDSFTLIWRGQTWGFVPSLVLKGCITKYIP